MTMRDYFQGSSMSDGFERRIDYLRISLTDRCNFRCLYCMPGGGIPRSATEDSFTAGEIVRIGRIAKACGITKIRLTGGEPLLRGDIVPLVRSLKNDVGIREVSLTTNGTRLAELAVPLKKAGLDRVNVSLDTMHPERFRLITRGGDIARVWDGLAAAEDAGLSPIKINMVPLTGVNDDEIVSFAALTFEKDFHVRFIERMPVGSCTDTNAASLPAAVMRERISALGELVPLPFRGGGPSRNCRISGARGVIGFISALTDHFCASCNRLRITSSGMLRPCLFSDGGIDLRTAIRSGAGDEDIAELFRLAVSGKPRGHTLHAGSRTPASAIFAMSEIGG